jgi:hypothetical protein
MGFLQRLAFLGLLTPGLLAQTTPTDFLVRVHMVEVSQDGLVWLEAFSPPGGHLVDIVGTGVQNLGQGELPVGDYPSVRVSLSAIMQIEVEDPCGGGTIIDLVDYTGDPVIDPDGDSRWEIHFSTSEYGGTNQGTGSLTSPLTLNDVISVRENEVAPLRMVLGVTGNVHCEDDLMVVDPPRAQLSLLETDTSNSITGTTYQVTGMRVQHEDGGPGISTFKGAVTMHGDGRWTSDLIQWRGLSLADGETSFGANPWSGWWSSMPDGGLWMTQAGIGESMTGWMRTGNGAFSVASTGGGSEALLFWGIRGGTTATGHPFTSPQRLIVHDFDLVDNQDSQGAKDLHTWRLFGRFLGDEGWLHFDYTTQRNSMRINEWIGGTPSPPIVDIDWLPLGQGMAYTVAPGISHMALTLLDLQAYYEGWLSPDGDIGILDRRDHPPNRQGLALTMRIGAGMNNSSVSGRAFKGGFVQDSIVDFGSKVATGRLTIQFNSSNTCVWKQTTTDMDGSVSLTTAGTFELWSEGRLVVNLADGRKFEGQVDPARNNLAITSSEDGVQGAEDRMIGFLVRP